MTTQSQLNALGTELAEMMREYNALKLKLIGIIDDHGVAIDDEHIMTPAPYDHIFNEAGALLEKIMRKLLDAYCFCVQYNLPVPDVIYAARDRLAEHQAFFHHLKHDCPKLH